MKTIMHVMMAVLLTVIISPVKAGNPVWETQTKAPQVVSHFRTINFTDPIPAKEFDKCKKYKNKQIAGFVLLPVSVGMMAGGAYMIYTGAKHIVDATEIGIPEGIKTEVSNKDKMLLGVGAGVGFVGFLLLPTSLVLGIKGGTNYNRDCRGGGGISQRTIYLRPTGNGINMALKF